MSATSGNGSTQFYKGGEDVLPHAPGRVDLSPASYTSKAVGGARKSKRVSAKMIGCAGGTKKTKKTAKKSRKSAKLFWFW